MHLIFRPIDVWPQPWTTSRKPGPFSATWSDTLQLLDKEIDLLTNGGKFHTEVVIQVAAGEGAMRIDGGLRADAKTEHPGVIINFEHPTQGPLQYATDVFDNGQRWKNGRYETLPGWQMNARAIALGLEALRKVDRYGIAKRGEQYTGFRALGSGTPMPAAEMTVEQAATFIALHGEYGASYALIDNEECRNKTYRKAAAKLHPDAGGSTELFQKLQQAKAVLDKHAS
jgi:hypothetical protein